MSRRSLALFFIALLVLTLGGTPAAARGFSTVVIDAGHGAHDFGGQRGSLFEKHLTLDISRRLERFLRQNGVRTVMTRATDRFVPLEGRSAISSRLGGAVFVSVHTNDASREGASGLETYYHTSEGQKLASLVQAQMLRNSSHGGNRGVKQARFKVLRSNSRPAILVEAGFVSNGRDNQRLRDPAYREAIAQSIGLGLLQYRRR